MNRSVQPSPLYHPLPPPLSHLLMIQYSNPQRAERRETTESMKRRYFIISHQGILSPYLSPALIHPSFLTPHPPPHSFIIGPTRALCTLNTSSSSDILMQYLQSHHLSALCSPPLLAAVLRSSLSGHARCLPLLLRPFAIRCLLLIHAQSPCTYASVSLISCTLLSMPPFASLCLPLPPFASICLPLPCLPPLPPFASLCLPLPAFACLCLPLPAFACLCLRCHALLSLPLCPRLPRFVNPLCYPSPFATLSLLCYPLYPFATSPCPFVPPPLAKSNDRIHHSSLSSLLIFSSLI